MSENQQEMYDYLCSHAYVSKTKKDQFKQEEMTPTRAECIACKCGNMIDEKTKKLQERIDKAITYIKKYKEEKQSLVKYLEDEINFHKDKIKKQPYLKGMAILPISLYQGILERVKSGKYE